MPEPSDAESTVFISYAIADKKKALQITTALEQRGYVCWIAPRDVRAGKPYGDEIIRGIELSNCLILILSKGANESPFVAREVERAISKRKSVFPVRIEQVVPGPSLELFVSTTHWIDAWSGPLQPHIDQLTSLLDEEKVSRVAAPSPPPPNRLLTLRTGAAAAVVVALLGAGVVWSAYRDSWSDRKALLETSKEGARDTQDEAVDDTEVEPKGEEKTVETDDTKVATLAPPAPAVPETIDEPAVAVIPAPEPPAPQYQVGDTFQDCAQCPEMVVVPSGTFMMGAPRNEPLWQSEEQPQHSVTISRPFAIGKYEVTFDEWDACVADGGCGGYRPSDESWGRGRRPVVNVSWEDAKSYADWLSKKTGEPYRLPSEAEWEYAARAGTTTPFWWGLTISTTQANYDGKYRYGRGAAYRTPTGEPRHMTVPVDSFAANAWGLHQVHGKAWEWVEDCYNETYEDAPVDGSAWKSGDCSFRVLKGGSWEFWPQLARSAARNPSNLATRDKGSGFRVVREILQ